MAKRAPVDEQPFRPLLDPGVISAALSKPTPQAPAQPAAETSQAKIVEMPQAQDTPKRLEASRVGSPRPQVQEIRNQAAPNEFVEKFDQEKRMLLTRPESLALDRLVNSLASRLNTQVKLSHVLRSLVALLLNSEAQIDRRAGETVGLVRPPNGDANALQRFEREIAKILGSAIRDAGPLR
jgi:hypothetical protein